MRPPTSRNRLRQLRSGRGEVCPHYEHPSCQQEQEERCAGGQVNAEWLNTWYGTNEGKPLLSTVRRDDHLIRNRYPTPRTVSMSTFSGWVSTRLRSLAMCWSKVRDSGK